MSRASPWVAVVVLGLVSCRGADRGGTTLEWDDELSLTPDRNVVDISGDPQKQLYAVGNGVYRREKSTWREVSFAGRPRALSAVSVIGDELWAVGRSGAAVHYDGKIWDVERAEADGRSGDLVDVIAWPNEVWATAGKGEIWRRRDKRWQVWKPAELADLALGSIWGSAPSRVYVAAGSSLALWDGAAWNVTPVPQSGKIHAVHGAGADDVWAVGEAPRGGRKAALALHFDGKDWKATELDVEHALLSVYVRAKNEVWAGGEQGTLVKWDGSAWQSVAGLPATPVVQVFAAAAGPVLVNLDRHRISRAR